MGTSCVKLISLQVHQEWITEDDIMSTYMTNKWNEEMNGQIPRCPACKGEMSYGYLVSREPIHWAGDIENNQFKDVESPMTGEFKKPLGIPMAKCISCRLFITVLPP